MKTISILMRHGSVRSYNAREQKVEIALVLNDGKDKMVVKQLSKESPDTQAQGLLSEIREKLRTAHGGSSSLSNFVNIRFVQDEEDVLDKMTVFINSVMQKMRTAQTKTKSYADIERDMMRYKLNFEDKRSAQKESEEDVPVQRSERLEKPKTIYDELGLNRM